jgi:hypothetical protein
LPTRRERSVQPADFSIAGLIGFFGRQYEKAFEVKNTREIASVFGEQFNPATYGWDAANGFFANLAGESGSLFILSPKGAAATQAYSTAVHANLNIVSARQGEPSFGAWNNNIGVKMRRANGFIATLSAAAAAATVDVDSVAGFKAGDQLVHNGASAAIYKVVSVNANLKQIELDAPLAGAQGDTLAVVGYNLQVFVKHAGGEIAEAEPNLGKTLVTLNESDSSKFISNVFASSSYIGVEKLADINAVVTDSASIVFLTGGNDGAMPSNDYTPYFSLFNGLPIRMCAIAETSNFTVHQAFEAYCRSRGDNPVVIYVGPEGVASKDALIQMGNGLQRMDEVDGVYVHNWLKIADPFSDGATATRVVPNCGHVMGLWIRSIAKNGVHSIPARKNTPLAGVIEPVGYAALDDVDRTSLAEAGVNVIQNVRGAGNSARNFFTLSTSAEFRFANAVIQRNFIKLSCVDALQISENTPNGVDAVENDRIIVINFMRRLWKQGSNGNIREGETFGQYMRDDGTLSTEEDAYEVIADASNNPVAHLQAGNRNIDIFFMFPAPAGSIRIGVGLIYKA